MTFRHPEAIGSGQYELLHGMGKSLILVGCGYPAGSSLHLGGGVPHGDAQPRVGKHQDVVRHVTDRGYLRCRYGEPGGKEFHNAALVGIGVSNVEVVRL